ncbi:ankyrin repeat domain-containing protein [Vibrio sp. S9_S30]|uniref:ankyrin repeat domain-containing protein n=1 Tax=Vibrio sp. S9_S30 TaxID=2720226 RepID=UPI0016800910|nr:ankyrin repeat domain-containing protein [Vibrio sp. S9_S30]MBD1557001.1 ankyrin repeat domain-containing protein [Vibrio sp. S9_S30]
MSLSKPNPATFFSGEMLDVARAIKNGDIEKVLLLGKRLENIDKLGKGDLTLLAFSVYDNNAPAIKALMSLGADPSVEIPNQGNIAYIALWRTSTESLTALLESGMSPDITQTDTPIIFLTPKLEESEALNILIKNGANINIRDSVGGTALDEFISVNRLDEALLLLINSADATTMKDNGLSTAYTLQYVMQDLSSNDKNYAKLLEIKEYFSKQGVKFPALSPEEERKKHGIIWCDEPEGWVHHSKCKSENSK